MLCSFATRAQRCCCITTGTQGICNGHTKGHCMSSLYLSQQAWQNTLSVMPVSLVNRMFKRSHLRRNGYTLSTILDVRTHFFADMTVLLLHLFIIMDLRWTW